MIYKSHSKGMAYRPSSKNRSFFQKHRKWAICLPLLVFLVSACAAGKPQAEVSDNDFIDRLMIQFRTAQPLHFYNYSQDIAGLQAVYDARVRGTTTYSIFFNRGQADPVWMCPSRGYPIPGDSELTNTERAVYAGGSYSYYTLPQYDPNGIMTSNSTQSTYVQCIADDGSTYIQYAEPDVMTFPFPVTWDYQKHQAVQQGGSKASFTVPFDQQKAANAVQGNYAQPTPTPTR